MPPAKKSIVSRVPTAPKSRIKNLEAAAKVKAASAQALEEPTSRRTKRRMDTRFKLMRAALCLMAEKGLDGVTIQDITNVADVGFGSFYNHFPSKEAVFNSLKDELIEHYAAALDQLGELLTDPAEKIASSARYTIRHARMDPLWGKFVLATNFNRETMRSGLGRFLLRDIIQGIEAGRFTCHHFPSLVLSVGTTILAGVMAEVQPPQDVADPLGSAEDMPENISATLLLTLGLTWQEAQAVTSRALPNVVLPINPFRVDA